MWYNRDCLLCNLYQICMVALILELKKEYIYIGMIVSGLNEQGEHTCLNHRIKTSAYNLK